MKKTKRNPVTVPFSRMNAAQKRVAIARDAVKQIRAKQFVMDTGTWCEFAPGLPEQFFKTVDAQAMFNGTATIKIPQPVCRTCALGAALVSSVRLFDRFKFSNTDVKTKEVTKQLGQFFSAKQMLLIETAYEQRSWDDRTRWCDLGLYPNNVMTEQENNVAQTFGLNYRRDTDRALAIFQNIVRNNGEFKP